ncbi:hypothetical protein STRDD11_00453 [Streptococcus sp. DD11]|nr:hypothetical protein STRDD11_00453 [Streptococcus sp. DD11]
MMNTNQDFGAQQPTVEAFYTQTPQQNGWPQAPFQESPSPGFNPAGQNDAGLQQTANFSDQLGQKPQKNQTGKWIGFLGIGLAAGLFLGGLGGYFLNDFMSGGSTQLVSTKNVRKGQQTNFAAYVAQSEDDVYEWKMKDFEKLNFHHIDDDGLTPDQVIEQFGLASNVTFQEEGLSLSWLPDSGYTSLTFVKDEDGVYRLNGMHAMPGSDDYDRKVSDQITEKLKTGDKETGEGGSSFTELVKEFPEYRSISVFGDGELAPEMQINYETSSSKELNLIFIRQEDGRYLLSNILK